MLSAVTTIFYLLVFFMVGFWFSRAKLIKPEHSKSISTLILYAFIPCTIINSFMKDFTIANIRNYLLLLLVATGLLLVNVGLSFLLSKLSPKDPYAHRVYRYASVVPNGELGYGFGEGMLGNAGILTLSIFNIPTCIYTYTFGYNLLTNQQKSLKKLLNPVTISVVVGIVLGLLPFEMPDILQNVFSKGAACTIPVSMVVIGITISEFKVLDLFKNRKAIIFCLIRMVAFPLVLRLVLPFFLPHEVVQAAVLFYALPCGKNSIIITRMMDKDVRPGAELVLISSVIAIVSIPLVTLGLF